MEITRAVKQVADRQGIDIVIRKTAHQPAPDLDPSQP